MSGEGYTVFIDSDDYVDKNYFKLLSSHDEDIVFIDVIRRNIDTGKRVKECLSQFSNLSKDKFLRSQMTGKILWGGVRKAVKTDIISKNRIRFSEHKIGEEALYSFDVLFYSKSMGFIDCSVYTYEVRSDSLSHTNLDDPWGPVAIALRNKIKEKGLYDNFADTLNSFLYSAAAVSVVRIAKNYDGKEYKKTVSKRIASLNDSLDKSIPYDRESLNIKVKVLIPMMKFRMLNAIHIISNVR